jgi:tol-pal system protein YbgF
MKRVLVLSALLWGLSAVPVHAAGVESELANIREELQVLQRQMYRNNDNAEQQKSDATADIQKKLTAWEETMRQYNGRQEEIEHRMQQLEQKLDKLNRDIEIRFKILEGRPIPSNLTNSTVTIPQTYNAPVATGGAKAVVGDNIKTDELKPLKSEEETSAESAKAEVKPEVKAAETAQSIKADEMYAAAMQAYNGGYFDEAELAFERILKEAPKHKLAGNAQYWLGEVYVKQGHPQKAKVAFKNGYEKYKDGNKAADSLYRLGVILANLKETKNACIVFNSFDEEFPKAEAELKKKAANEAKRLGC